MVCSFKLISKKALCICNVSYDILHVNIRYSYVFTVYVNNQGKKMSSICTSSCYKGWCMYELNFKYILFLYVLFRLCGSSIFYPGHSHLGDMFFITPQSDVSPYAASFWGHVNLFMTCFLFPQGVFKTFLSSLYLFYPIPAIHLPVKHWHQFYDQ